MPSPFSKSSHRTRDPNVAERAILGVVHAGGETVRGLSGAAHLLARAKLSEAQDYDSGKTKKSPFVPIMERHKDKPWYERIARHVGDAMGMKTSSREVLDHVKHASGKWSSDNKESIHSLADESLKEHKKADSSVKEIEPKLGKVGRATSFAAKLSPGVRALDIPVAAGEDLRASNAAKPALASWATRKIKIPYLRNAAQQALTEASK